MTGPPMAVYRGGLLALVVVFAVFLLATTWAAEDQLVHQGPDVVVSLLACAVTWALFLAACAFVRRLRVEVFPTGLRRWSWRGQAQEVTWDEVASYRIVYQKDQSELHDAVGLWIYRWLGRRGWRFAPTTSRLRLSTHSGRQVELLSIYAGSPKLWATIVHAVDPRLVSETMAALELGQGVQWGDVGVRSYGLKVGTAALPYYRMADVQAIDGQVRIVYPSGQERWLACPNSHALASLVRLLSAK